MNELFIPSPYAGGYIGLFIGYTIAQAPELVIGLFGWIKNTLRLTDRTRYAIQ